ncbi:MAG: pantetheine-phosphate adenylyltransferase [Holosporales bacterium]
MKTGIYPGTFDPPTNGHFDIISRAARLVDRLIVAVAPNAGKNPLFTPADRVSMLEEHLPNLKLVSLPQVQMMRGLLVDFAHDHDATVIFRGLRAVADFDYELQMAMMNTRLAPHIETVFLMASETHQFLASKLVKEVAFLGGDISSFVPESIQRHLSAKQSFIQAAAVGQS